MRRGAYGYEIVGLPHAGALLGELDAPLGRLEIVRSDATPRPDSPQILTDREALFPMLDGVWVSGRRDSSVVVAHLERPTSDDDLVHPFLSPVVAVQHLWADRQVLHGGVVGIDGSAVVVLGGREFGKSTTLGHLAVAGRLEVLSDDLCVTDGHWVWTGPRCIDLRPTTARAFQGEWSGRMVRSAGRARLDLPAAEERSRLVGAVLLGWGDRLDTRRMDAGQSVQTIVASKVHREVPSDPTVLLDVGVLPMLEVRRPRNLSSLESTAALIEGWLLDLAASSA